MLVVTGVRFRAMQLRGFEWILSDFMFNHTIHVDVLIFPKSILVSMTINGNILVAIHYLLTFDLLFHQIKSWRKGK